MLEKIKEADKKARSKYTYKYDPAGTDQWRSFAKDVLAGKAWKGDCDDLASTACELAYRLGVPLKALWFANVSSKRTTKIDHMIAFAKIEDRLYVIGDTFGPCYLATQMSHGPTRGDKFYVANLTNVLDWKYLSLKEMLAA